MRRRTFLSTAGTALGTAAIGANVASAISFDRTVDIVEAGADNTGEEPIDDVFEEVARDGTLIEFPEGEYVVNHLSLWNLSTFGLRATGDATLVPGDDYRQDWIAGSEGTDLLFEGFTLDHTRDGVGPSIKLFPTDGLIVRDIEKRGTHDSAENAFHFRVTDSDGQGLVENLVATDGSADGCGIYIDSAGTITVRDCNVQRFGDNGLYASNSDGPIQVERGRYQDNEVSQVRLGSSDSYVQGADVGVIDPPGDNNNMRGIRIADGPGPVTIEECDIRVEAGHGNGGIVGAFDGGSFTVRNTRINVEPDYTTVNSGDEATSYGIYVDEASGIDDPGTRTIQDVSVTGSGDGRAAMWFRRGNNTVETTQIEQDGDERAGLVFVEGVENNEVVDSAVETTGPAIVDEGSVTVSGLSTEADPTEASFEDDNTTESSTDSDDSTTETTESTDNDDSTTETTETSTDNDDSTTETTETSTDSHHSTAETDGSDEDRRASTYSLPDDTDTTYATMGDADAPELTVYGSFKCPYTTKFLKNNFAHIVEEFVRPGKLSLRFRTLAYETDDPDHPLIGDSNGGELAARYALAVWDVDPDSYWTFFETVLRNQPSGRWVTHDRMTQFLEDADVESIDKVRRLVEAGRYEKPVRQTVEDASDLGVDLVPRIELDGDLLPARRDSEVLCQWINDRL